MIKLLIEVSRKIAFPIGPPIPDPGNDLIDDQSDNGSDAQGGPAGIRAGTSDSRRDAEPHCYLRQDIASDDRHKFGSDIARKLLPVASITLESIWSYIACSLFSSICARR